MPAFQYEAAKPTGELTRGVIEADSERHARSLLKAQGLIALDCAPVAASAVSSKTAPNWLENLSRRSALSETERTLLIRQLSSLLQAGLPQEQALNVLLSQTTAKPAQGLLGAVRSSVLGGASLSQALGEHPATFSADMVAMAAAGEQSGKLAQVLEYWADYLETRAALRQQVVASMAYPIIVAVVALLMVLGLMTYVVPQIVGVFQNAKTSLPLLTTVMMAISGFLRAYGLYLLAATILASFIVRAWLKRPAPKLAFHGWLLGAPLIGGLVQAAQTERFASTLSILIRGGVPMLAALNAAQRTLSNTVLAGQVEQAIVRVREGATLARGLEHAQSTHPLRQRMASLLTHLIASGEATGCLPDMLARAAQLLGSALQRQLQTLTTILEPLIILVMGGVVLLIVMAVLLPIIEINQLVR